jgi:hypothetical protein
MHNRWKTTPEMVEEKKLLKAQRRTVQQEANQ